MKKERIRWIDMAKGIGMLLVIIGHLNVPYINVWIYTFHIPLFFMLSGCVFNGYEVKFKDFLIKKIKSIVVPYFCLGIFLPIFFSMQAFFVDKQTDVNVYFGFFKDFIVQKQWFTIWFIACLFIVELLFYGIVKICKNNLLWITVCSFVMAALIMLYIKFNLPSLPWNIDIAFSALPFFAIGYLIFNNKKIYDFVLSKRPVNVIAFLGFSLINVVGMIVSDKIFGAILNMSVRIWGCPIISYIAAVAGSVCVIMFSNLIVIKPIEYIGKHSLVYYAWHSRIMIPLCGYLYTALGTFKGNSVPTLIIQAMVSLFIILVVLTVCDIIIRNTKLRFMVGVFPNKKIKESK